MIVEGNRGASFEYVANFVKNIDLGLMRGLDRNEALFRSFLNINSSIFYLVLLNRAPTHTHTHP